MLVMRFTAAGAKHHLQRSVEHLSFFNQLLRTPLTHVWCKLSSWFLSPNPFLTEQASDHH